MGRHDRCDRLLREGLIPVIAIGALATSRPFARWWRRGLQRTRGALRRAVRDRSADARRTHDARPRETAGVMCRDRRAARDNARSRYGPSWSPSSRMGGPRCAAVERDRDDTGLLHLERRDGGGRARDALAAFRSRFSIDATRSCSAVSPWVHDWRWSSGHGRFPREGPAIATWLPTFRRWPT